MNYLAHLLLAGDDPEALVGNLMGDFVRGSALEGYSESIRRGIVLHRRIDAFTDSHPVVRASKRRMGPANRRYAGVAVDLFYDHFLAAGWSCYADAPLHGWTARVYGVLRAHEAVMPERMQRAVRDMVAQDRLRSYATIDGIQAALARMSRHVRRENSLASACEDLVASYPAFEADFREFFPDLAAHVAEITGRRTAPGGRTRLELCG